MIKNTLPNKSANPESLKKQSKNFKSSPTSVLKVSEDLPTSVLQVALFTVCDSSDL